MNNPIFLLTSVAAYVYLILAFISIVSEEPNKPYDDATLSMDKDTLMKALLKYMSSSDEQILGILCARNVEKYLATDSTKRGFCFITNKACYFMGKIYKKKGIFLFRENNQHRLINSELKGIKVDAMLKFKNFIFTIISLFLIALEGYTLYYLDQFNADQEIMIIVVLNLISLPFLIIFFIYSLIQIFISRKTFVCMEFANITIAFPIYTVGELEAKEFYRVISKVQDHERKREISNIPDRSPQQIPATPLSATQDKIGSLKELSTLYAQKLINEQEYNSLKKQLLQDTDSSASADTQESETTQTQ